MIKKKKKPQTSLFTYLKKQKSQTIFFLWVKTHTPKEIWSPTFAHNPILMRVELPFNPKAIGYYYLVLKKKPKKTS